MDWTSAARTLLNTPPVPTCPALQRAFTAVDQSDLEAAARELATLNEEQRLLATFLVEIAAANADADAAALASLCEDLHGLAENTIDLNDLPATLLHAWADAVAPRIPPAVVARRDAFGYGQTLLCHGIERLCADGNAERALSYAALLTPYHCGDVARAWSKVAFALPIDHAERADALMRAAQAGSARPMIQDGGEEASAHGVAMQAFAAGGLAADNPAVTHAVKGLLKLARHRARRDVRSHGVATASIAAGQRAAQDADAGWLAIAEQLAAKVWDEGPIQTQALATAQQARAAIAPRKASTVALPATPKGNSHEDLAIRRAAGEDVDAEIEVALREWNGNGYEAVAHFVNGCRLGLDDARLEALLAVARPDSRSEALIKAASYAIGAPDARRAAWLNRGYPEGDCYGIYTADLLHWLTPEKLLAGEVLYAASGQNKALGQLIGLHMRHGRMDDAARVIARIGQPQVNDAWVPSYRRGGRANDPLPADALMRPRIWAEPTPVTAETLKAELSQAKTGSALYALALGAADADVLAKVVKASRLKKWAKKAAQPWIARIRLHTDDVDAAIGVFEGWASGRFDDHQATALLHSLALHLRETGAVTPDRVRRLTALFAQIHPMWPVHALTTLARAAIQVEPSERDAMTTLIQSAMRSRYRRTGDYVFALMGLAHGRIEVGDLEAGRALLREAVVRASDESIYFKGSALLVTLAEVASALPPDEFKAHCIAALQACTRHERHAYAQLQQVEWGLRSLWPKGVDVTLALFAPDILPQTLSRDLLRSIWADIEHVPEPLRVLGALWPSAPVLPEIAIECVQALAQALAQVEHPALAEVEAMLAAAQAG